MFVFEMVKFEKFVEMIYEVIGVEFGYLFEL